MGARVSLVGLCLFLAVAALAGAIWFVPQMDTSLLRFFSDYTLPAVALGTVGVVALAGAVLLWVHKRAGADLALTAGAAIVVFECVEALAVGNLISPPEGAASSGALWLQPFFVLFGIAMVLLSLRVRRHAVI